MTPTQRTLNRLTKKSDTPLTYSIHLENSRRSAILTHMVFPPKITIHIWGTEWGQEWVLHSWEWEWNEAKPRQRRRVAREVVKKIRLLQASGIEFRSILTDSYHLSGNSITDFRQGKWHTYQI